VESLWLAWGILFVNGLLLLKHFSDKLFGWSFWVDSKVFDFQFLFPIVDSQTDFQFFFGDL
jgi:hypothetical protein